MVTPSREKPRVETDTDPGPVVPRRHVVRVSGDMDIEHVGELRTALLEAVSQAPEHADIIIDLMHSSFCDSAGLATLLSARRRAAESGHLLRLAAPSHQLLRLLELCDVPPFPCCQATFDEDVPARAPH
ncbi:STAS domain-containing protein [Streptomyces sp. ISL-94]|uniref:STAS domain-containing protein n=1 Tax=Streptomyces sp. ISL-94 TaxID=2819190 RepID=UPI001BE4F9DE|nr:STAS domain-containing protein [Streptomyces sp. ISL-94]MBT2478862.1 STAS domain-containing protein [Streptomyces sp. ISL-94]